MFGCLHLIPYCVVKHFHQAYVLDIMSWMKYLLLIISCVIACPFVLKGLGFFYVLKFNELIIFKLDNGYSIVKYGFSNLTFYLTLFKRVNILVNHKAICTLSVVHVYDCHGNMEQNSVPLFQATSFVGQMLKGNNICLYQVHAVNLWVIKGTYTSPFTCIMHNYVFYLQLWDLMFYLWLVFYKDGNQSKSENFKFWLGVLTLIP